VFARAFPGSGGRYPVSINGGLHPLWSRDGRTLYYWEGNSLIAASITTAPDFAVMARHTLFSVDALAPNLNSRSYDLAPDGSHFVMIAPASAGKATLTVASNWAAEIRARLSTAEGRR
jgi:hypothetical protein